MRLAALFAGAGIAFLIASTVIGFTSAAQSQKTLVFTVVLSGILCPLFYWITGKVHKSVKD